MGPMKVYMSVDIEGATGIASFSQCGRPLGTLADFGFARSMLVADLNAAIRGARRAGATQVWVKDSHATCKNLLVADLEAGTNLISGSGSEPHGMMEGIDSRFAASMLVGYHATCGALSAMMEHALVGGLARFWINGELAGEIAASAAVAGAFNVPTVLVTSDRAGCEEAARTIPSVRTIETKVGFGRYMGQMRHSDDTAAEIEQAAFDAVLASDSIRPYVIEGPVTLRSEFRSQEEADLASLHPLALRIDAYTVETRGDTFLEAHTDLVSVYQLSICGRKTLG